MAQGSGRTVRFPWRWRFMRMVVSLMGWALLSLVMAPRAVAAPGDAIDNKFLPPPRTLLQRLNRGKQAIKEGQFNVAVDELGSILSPEPDTDAEADVDQDYFIVGEHDSGAMPSLKTEVQRLIGSMPKEGRDLYTLRYGAAAKALLEEAVTAGDLNKLTDVTRRFFHTPSGYIAMMLLGRYHFDEGRPLAAALCFERLAASPAALAEFDPELSILLAACWMYAGAQGKAESVLIHLRDRQPNASWRIGDQTVAMFRNDAQALDWLRNVLGKLDFSESHNKADWVMFRGDPSRNARSLGGMPVVNHRWLVPTANDPSDEELLRAHQRQVENSDGVLVPSVQPLAVNGVVLMRTPRRLMAVDFESGKRVWVFPWDDTPDEQAERSFDLPASRGAGSPRMLELVERLWRDAAYGQMTSDGELVFLLDDLSYASTTGNPTIIGPGGFPMANAGWPKTYNRLVALSLSREGALQWVVGGDDGADETALANTFFLGPPLPVMGQLFVLAEVTGELRLVVLDPRTGKLEWQQQLAHVDSATIDVDPVRRLAGATPSFADGVVVCPTSAGAVVAIDASNRSLLWGYQYSRAQNQILGSRVGGINRFPVQAPNEESWLDSTAIIHAGRVVLTPAESDELFCLDLMTGEPLWSPRKRGNGLFVACIHDDAAIVVGKHSIAAVDLKDGTSKWNTDIELVDETPSGRGFYSDHFYYLPTTAAHVLRIDLDAGKVVDRIITHSPLGNLICYRNQIISQGADWLGAYYQFDALRQWVDARLRVNPRDREALARKSDLLLQEGKRKEALDTMWTTYQADPSDDTIKTQLVETFLEALEEDFAGYADRIEHIEPLIEQPRQRMTYWRLVSAGLQRMGDLDGSFRAVLRLAEQSGPTPAAGEQPLERIDRRWSVLHDRWIQGRIASLLAAAAGEEYAPLRSRWNEQIRERLAAALQANSRTALRRFLEQFGSHPAADQARLRYAQILLEEGEYLQAELQLSPLLDDLESETAPKAIAMLADLLFKAQKVEEARAYYVLLKERWPDTVVGNGLTGSRIFQSVESLPAMVAAEFTSRPWPYTDVKIDEGFDAQRASPYAGFTYPVPIQDARGPFPAGTSLTVDARSNMLQVRDRFGQELQHAIVNNSGSPFANAYNLSLARANGHLIVVNVQSEIVAVDAMRYAQDPQEAVLWRFDVNENAPNIASRRTATKPIRHPWSQSGIRVVAADYSQARVPLSPVGPITSGGVCFQRYRQLVCVDPLSGQTVWTRDGIDPGAQLFGDEDYLFVVPYDQTEAIVLSTATGDMLGTRTVEKLENRWATWGRHVLAWEDHEGTLTLRVYDAWTRAELWKGEFPLGTRGELVDDDQVALFQASGEFVVVSIREGREVLRVQLDPLPAPAHLFVQRTPSAYYVLPGANLAVNPRLSITSPSSAAATPVLDGKLYALDAATGTRLWQNPGTIHGYSVPLLQPAASPVLVFVRSISQRTGQPRPQGSLLAIDKRDGRVLYANDELAIPNAGNLSLDVTSDPRARLVRIQFFNQSIALQYTDRPPPPAAPVQTADLLSYRGPNAPGGAPPASSTAAVAPPLGKNLE